MDWELFKAVRLQLGQENEDDFGSTMRDVANNSAAGGFPGFTYYADTTKFYDTNSDIIWKALCEDADLLASEPMQLVASFNFSINDETDFKNALAWYALERVAQRYVEIVKYIADTSVSTEGRYYA